jgi:hypothetical protein
MTSRPDFALVVYRLAVATGTVLFATVLAADPPTVTLEVRVTGDVERSGWLLLEPADEGATEPVERPHTAAGSQRFELPPDSLWRVRASVPGRWSPTVGARAGGAAVELPLLPAGTVAGSLRFTRNAEPPPWIEVHFESFDRAARGLAGSQECPISEDGAWSCLFPTGRFELRLKAPGFASAFRHDVEIAAGVETDLAPIDLIPGASVVGFVEVPDGSVAPADVEVELRPAGPSEQHVEHDKRLAGLAVTTRANAAGLFQFVDLAPGTYTLVARAAGLAPAEHVQLRVEPGLESRLPEALRLQPMVAVPFFVDPPVPPGGELWRLELHPVGVPDRVTRGETDPTGAWWPNGLKPGLYDMVVLEEGDDDSRWERRRLEIAAGMAPVEIELPLVAVEGEVRLGDEPVRTLLAFGGWRGEQRIDLYSDPEGRFHGVLPRAGEWEVAARFVADGAWHRLEPVVLERPNRGAARIELRLPDTHVAGRVVDARGRPVHRAKVYARRLDAEDRVDADSGRDGGFAFQGIHPGRYAIEAFRDGATGRGEVEVADGLAPPDAEIELVETTEIRGHLTHRGAPVAGAEVFAWPDFGSGRLFGAHALYTGALGEFKTDVPGDTLLVSLVVMPPGFAARLVTLPMSGDGFDVEVADLGGTLRVDLGERSRHRFLEHRGTVLPLELLRSWARLHGNEPSGGSWLLPRMEPGSYRLCTPDLECGKAATLDPGGVAVLAAPFAGTAGS